MSDPLMQDPKGPQHPANRSIGFILLLFIVINTFIGIVIATSGSDALKIGGVVVQLLSGIVAGAAMIQLSKK